MSHESRQVGDPADDEPPSPMYARGGLITGPDGEDSVAIRIDPHAEQIFTTSAVDSLRHFVAEAMYDHGRWGRPEGEAPPPTPEWTVSDDRAT